MMHVGKNLFWAALFAASLLVSAVASEDFPHRAHYQALGVPILSDQEVIERLGRAYVFDVRSDQEYRAGHIKGAYNIPVNHPDFTYEVGKITDGDPSRSVIFYCNGGQCEKSYLAAVRSIEAGIRNVAVYDGGAGEWLQKHVDLIEHELDDAAPVWSKRAVIAERSLTFPELEQLAVSDPDAIILDVRTARERDGVSMFMMRDHHVGMDEDQIRAWLEYARQERRTVLFIDESDFRPESLLPLIESVGLRDFWFLRGGLQRYYQDLRSRTLGQG